MRNFRWLIAVLAALAVAPVAAAAQQGTIMGQVVDETTRQPLSDVQIFVEGTTRGTLTNQQGRYQLVGIPVGTHSVRATRIGYNQSDQQVTVNVATPSVANFALSPAAVELGAVIVTATGEKQAVREIGNAVGKINVAEEVELVGSADLSQVLTARTAGVTVLQSSGTTGSGSRIRIRGSNSVSLSNDPLLIIDGVRVDNNSSSSIGVGGQDTNRFNDLNPENIESIEVLKGPAASALYGTAAANGVIVVTTKKGRSGDTRWNVYTEQGMLEEVTEFPANYGALATGQLASFCITAYQALGLCEFQELVSFNPLEDPRTTPFQDGYRQKYGASVTGGNDLTTYFLSGDFENEDGIYEINYLDRINLRANMATQLREGLDVTLNTGYINSDLRLPQNDNNILGIVSGGLLSFTTEFEEEDEACGFLILCPEDIFAIDTRQNVERITGSTNARWVPIPWLSINGTAGLDVVNRFDNETIPPERVAFSTLIEGTRESNRIRVSNYTANLGATANYNIRENITGTSSLGTQYNEEIFRGTYAQGEGLLTGCSSLNCVAARFAIDEVNTQVRTIGGYFQQQLSFADRFYLTGAVRADDNSAFGNDFGLIAYPSVSASYVISDEGFFPAKDFIDNFRLRAAYGQSGLRPDFRDAVRFLSPTTVTVAGASVPSFEFGGVGNLGLRPERSTEFETGFDAGLLNNRLGVELTYYNKQSEDALIFRRLPPSLGVSTGRFDNLGEVRNEGLELLVSADLVQTPRFRWSATSTAAWTENELEELGVDPTTGEPIAPIIFGLGGNTQRHTEGFPLGAYFARPIIGFEDEDGDGLLSPSEVEVGDSAVFLGNPFPTREASFSTEMTFFNTVKLTGLLDYRGGFSQFNSTREFRCTAFFNCQDAYDPTTPLPDQAAFIAGAFEDTPAGYIEEADFLKLREVTLTFTVPSRWNQRIGVSGSSISVAGRNLATWTDYTGFDPEINFAGTGSNFTTAEFLTQPPLRSFNLRFDVQF